MKLNSFKFQDGKVFWLPEYPEERPHLEGYIIDPYLDPVMHQVREEKIEGYNQLVAQSLASAIEVAPEEIIIIKRLIVESVYKNGRVGDATKVITSMWQPENGKVYSAECGIEVEYQYRNDNTKTGRGWWKCSEQYYRSKQRPYEFRQVARLKPNNEEKELEEHEIIADKWNMPRLGGARSILQTTTKEFEGMEGKWTVTQSKFGSCLLEFTHPEKQTRWLRPTGITKAELQSIADQLNKDEIFPAANSHDMKENAAHGFTEGSDL